VLAFRRFAARLGNARLPPGQGSDAAVSLAAVIAAQRAEYGITRGRPSPDIPGRFSSLATKVRYQAVAITHRIRPFIVRMVCHVAFIRHLDRIARQR
jgi:hypothetical protein